MRTAYQSYGGKKKMNLKEVPIIYTLETTGVAGGHKVVFEQINALYDEGYNVHLWALGGQPKWFDLKVPVGIYPHYHALRNALTEMTDAIKVATWWKTADPVYTSVMEGGGWGFYLVQDIETSYYEHMRGHPDTGRVLETYNFDLNFLTTSPWVTKTLKKHTKSKNIHEIGLGIDLDLYTPNRRLVDVPELVTIARRNPLKNFPLAVETIRIAMDKVEKMHVSLFGIESMDVSGNAHLISNPTNEEVASLYRGARCYLATSKHEGYNLPILEAMASGCPVVTTLADGNNHFCVDEENCLIGTNAEELADAIRRIMTDDSLAEKLRKNGLETAKKHSWDISISKLVQAFGKAIGGINEIK